jgi:hypothetical protein
MAAISYTLYHNQIFAKEDAASGAKWLTVRISVRLFFIMSERLIDATSILHYELEAPPV